MGLAIKNNNPGNIKDTSTGQFRQFATPQEGYAALLNDLETKKSGRSQTGLRPESSLIEFSATYAPKGDKNSPGQYAANLANQMGVRPDTPIRDLDVAKWAAAIAKNEDKDSTFANQKIDATSYNPAPFSNPSNPGAFNYSSNQEQPTEQKPQGFIQETKQNVSDAVGGVKSAYNRASQGEINPLSGFLQAQGAIAGGINDLSTTALHHTPVVGKVVKKVEDAVGGVAQKAVNTDLGQKAVGTYQDFAQEHPEAAGNIGAAINIASAVPVVKGAFVAKNAVKRGLTSAFKGSYDDIARSALKTPPKLSEVKAGIKGGRISQGKFGPELTPDESKVLSADYLAKEMEQTKFPKTKNESSIATFADDAADTEAIKLERMLDDAEIQNIAQPEDLGGMFDATIKRAGTSMTSGENPAKTLLEVFQKNLPEGREILPGDILRARRAVGSYIRQNRGDWSMRGVLTGYKSARDAFWDESRKLLTKLAPDVDVLGSLEKQTALYRVVDYMAPKVLKELKDTANTSFMKRHPVVKGLVQAGTSALATGAGVGGIMQLFGKD